MQIVSRWRPALAAGVLSLAAAPGFAAAPPQDPAANGPVEVSFRDPGRFTDIGPDRQLQAEWMADLRRHLQQRAAPLVPPGDRLRVTVTDVARAGVVRHLPSRDLRVVRDNAASSRIDLDFQLLSPGGEVLREGSRHLGDIGHRYRDPVGDDGAAALENRLIDDWLQREFRSP